MLAGLLSIVIAAGVLKLWRGSLGIPMYLVGDNPLLLSAVKGVLDNGWYFHNPFLGAPFGQDSIDFSGLGAENLQWAVLWVIGNFVGSAAGVVNLYLLISFPLIAVVSFLVLRDFCISRRASVVVAVLFSLLPYHFAKAEAGHLQLAMYVAVPLAVWLILRVLLGIPLFRRRSAHGWRSWVSWPNAAVLTAFIVLGGSTLYYAIFTLLLLAFAAAFRTAVVRSWRALVPGAIAFAACGVILLANLAPGLLYRVSVGPNTALAVRTPWESQVYSLSLTQMLLPIPGHRLSAFASARETFANYSVVKGEGGIELGLLFSLGFIGGLAALVIWVLRPQAAHGPRTRFARGASVGMLAAFLLATYGGVSALIAYYGSPQIRAWGRIVPFIAFFSAILLGLGLDWLGRRLRRRSAGKAWWTALCVGVLLYGAWDQTSPVNVPAYEANKADWRDRAAFVQAVEREVPPGSMILQLPLFPFPESSGVAPLVGPYDPLGVYLHSGSLRWSWGAMKGRPEDWSSQAGGLSTSQLVTAAAAAGFAGIYVDGGGYPDNGRAVGAQIRSASSPAPRPIVSPTGRFRFYDLQPLQQRMQRSVAPAQLLRVSAALVTPVSDVFGAGFYPEESDGTTRWNWAGSEAVITFRNPARFAQTVRFTALVNGSSGSRVALRFRGRSIGEVVLVNGSAPLDLSLRVPPGAADLQFETDGEDVAPPTERRDLFMQFVNPTVTSVVLQRYAGP